MRRSILLISALLFILFLLSLVSGIIYFKSKKEHNKRPGRLQNMELSTLDSKIFSTSGIDSGPLLIVTFDPGCNHCLFEIESIIESDLSESDFKILLITRAPRDTVIKFCSDYSVMKYPNISVLLDSLNVFGEKFGSAVIPSNYIFDKNLCLVKVLEGEYKTETIIKYLSTNE